jgi:CheY-like chemotaxis protein
MPSVLIVDDEPENLRSLKRFLHDREPTWTVSTAQNESQAKAALAELTPDVIITDLVMTTEQGGGWRYSSKRRTRHTGGCAYC